MSERIPTVGVVALKDKSALLVLHGESAQHLTGVWGLPGGRLEPEETLLDAAAREFWEETGLTPDKETMVKMPSIYQGDIPRKNGEIMYTDWHLFLVKNFTGELVGSDETTPEWVDIAAMVELNLLPNTENAVREGLQL